MRPYYIPLWIFLACILLFLSGLFLPGFFDENFVLHRDAFLERPWTFVTSFFYHSDLAHLFYNMFALVVFGLVIERIIGSRMFLVAFFSGGLLASVAALLFYDAVLGASGAIYGTIGCIAVYRPRTILWALGVPMYAIAAAVVWALVDILTFSGGGNIAHASHLAGLVAGLCLGYALRLKNPQEKGKENEKQENEITESEFNEWEERYMRTHKKIDLLMKNNLNA